MGEEATAFVELDVSDFDDPGLAFALHGAVLTGPTSEEESSADEVSYVFLFLCDGPFHEAAQDSCRYRLLLIGFRVVLLISSYLLL